MKELESIVKNLDKIGNKLYNKFGADSYNIRCELHDIKEKLKAINDTHCCERFVRYNDPTTKCFTQNKKYRVLDDKDIHYMIVDDEGDTIWVWKKNFELLQV